ncbi:hypothetical protein [Variovorax sp. PAMC26660]|uniref:hypothetical protein n=1 Tax=Variovorax sp. PAMC26660 TaxID=2762322 RepID=UPI0039659387
MAHRTFLKLAAASAIAVSALCAAVSANAGPSWSIGVTVPGVVVSQPAPAYYEPAPVSSRPAPIYYQPAPPVRYQPPSYYAPAPGYYERESRWDERRAERREWRRREWAREHYRRYHEDRDD